MPDGEEPTGAAREALRRSKQATGYDGLVMPAKAVHGSPEPFLAVGVEPDWLCRFAYLPSLEDDERTTAALTAVLMNPDDPRISDEAYLLSKWMGCEVKEITDEQDNPVS